MTTNQIELKRRLNDVAYIMERLSPEEIEEVLEECDNVPFTINFNHNCNADEGGYSK